MLNNTKNKNSILIFIIIISSIFTNIFSQTQDIKNINYEKSAFEAFDNYDLQNSIKYFTILINQKPNEKFYIKRGICKYLLQDFKGAISDYDSSIKIKKTAEAYTNKGNVNEYLKNYNKAILDYDTAIKIDPEYPGAYSYKGLYFLYKKNDINQSNIYFKKAIELYNKAIEKNPSDKNIYNRKGKLEIVLKDYKSAINSFDKSLNLKPNIDAYLLKGSVYLNSDNYTEALKYFNEAIKINPEYLYSYYLKGQVYTRNREYKVALEYFYKALSLQNKNVKQFFINDLADIYSHIGYCYFNLENFKEAIKKFDEAIKLNPSSYNYYSRGTSKERLGDFKNALQDYDKAIELNPNYTLAYYGKGNSEKAIGSFIEAIKDYDKALQLDPKYGDIYYNRGLAKNSIHRYKEALEDFEISFKLPKNVPDYLLTQQYYTVGVLKINLKKYKEAVTDLDKAIELEIKINGVNSINLKDCYNYRSEAKEKLGDKAGAKEDFKKAKMIK